MDFYFSAPEWDGKTPNHTKSAEPQEPMLVYGATVVLVKDAFYRNTTFEGVFLLGPSAILPLPASGEAKLEILCRWYKHRLKTRGPEIAVDLSKIKVMENYTGYIMTDFNNLASD